MEQHLEDTKQLGPSIKTAAYKKQALCRKLGEGPSIYRNGEGIQSIRENGTHIIQFKAANGSERLQCANTVTGRIQNTLHILDNRKSSEELFIDSEETCKNVVLFRNLTRQTSM